MYYTQKEGFYGYRMAARCLYPGVDLIWRDRPSRRPDHRILNGTP